MKFINRLRAVVREESGQDLLEYALLVALIALVAVGAVTAAGTSVGASLIASGRVPMNTRMFRRLTIAPARTHAAPAR